MAIERKTFVDRVEITGDGVIQLRLKKGLMEGKAVLHFHYHRVTLVPGDDIEMQRELLNADLTAMGEAPVAAEEWRERVGKIAAVVHSPAQVAAYARVRRASGPNL